MPRVSRPALPASERKHGVCAVSLIGSAARRQHAARARVGQRDLRGRDQVLLAALVAVVVAAATDPEHVFLEFRQLAGALEHVAVDDVGRVALGVAVLLGVQVEHELGERAVQARDRPAQEREARAGELGAGVEIEAERRAEVDVVACRESRTPRGVPQRRTSTLPVSSAPTGTLACGRFGTPMQQRRTARPGSSASRSADAFSSSPMPATSAISALGVAALALELADLLGKRVAPRLQFLGARLDRLALALERAKRATSRKGWGDLRVSRRATTAARSLRSREMSSMTRRARRAGESVERGL